MKMRNLILLLVGLAALTQAPPAAAQYTITHDFLTAVEKNDFAEARSNLFKGANVNGRKDGLPGLALALKNRNYDMMRFLIDNGAFVNATTLGTNPQTTLMLAAVSGDEQGLELLLSAKADPNAIDRQGQSALMKAAANRHAEAARVLIAGGADIFQTDYTGRTAMQHAREARAAGVIKLLEEAGYP